MYCIVYELEMISGALKCDHRETVDLQYFGLDDMPELFCKQHEETKTIYRSGGTKQSINTNSDLWAAIRQWMATHFGYFNEWFGEAAFSNTKLKRENKKNRRES